MTAPTTEQMLDEFGKQYALASAPPITGAFTTSEAYDEARAAILARFAELEARDQRLMSKLGNFKGSGNVELDAALLAPDPAFEAFRDSLPDNYWARYDLTAVRLGWHYAQQRSAMKRENELMRGELAILFDCLDDADAIPLFRIRCAKQVLAAKGISA